MQMRALLLLLSALREWLSAHQTGASRRPPLLDAMFPRAFLLHRGVRVLQPLRVHVSALRAL